MTQTNIFPLSSDICSFTGILLLEGLSLGFSVIFTELLNQMEIVIKTYTFREDHKVRISVTD